MEIGLLIELIVTCAAIGTGGFVVAEILGFFSVRSANNSLVQTTSIAINAIVSMTGVGVTASQAAAVTEISGVPTQIIKPATPTA
jgi:hypothetical protein